MLRSSAVEAAHGAAENRCVLTSFAGLLVGAASSIGRWTLWPVPAVVCLSTLLHFDRCIAYMAFRPWAPLARQRHWHLGKCFRTTETTFSQVRTHFRRPPSAAGPPRTPGSSGA